MPIRSSRFVAWLIRWNGLKSRRKDSGAGDVQMLTKGLMMGEGIPDLTDYPKRLVQLNDLFATNEGSWDAISREDLIHYLTTTLLWRELEHIKDSGVESKWLEFRVVAVKPKTMIWHVTSKKRDNLLGQIAWYGPWRQYAFFPVPADVLFNAECLGDIKAFLENEMRKRKKR